MTKISKELIDFSRGVAIIRYVNIKRAHKNLGKKRLYWEEARKKGHIGVELPFTNEDFKKGDVTKDDLLEWIQDYLSEAPDGEYSILGRKAESPTGFSNLYNVPIAKVYKENDKVYHNKLTKTAFTIKYPLRKHGKYRHKQRYYIVTNKKINW